MAFQGNYREVLAGAHAAALEYVEGISDRRTAPSAEDLAGLSAFDELLLDTGRDPEDTIALLHRAGSPAAMGSAGGRFFGLVTGGALPVTIGANWIATAWDQVALNKVISPGARKLEEVAAGWILDLLNLPATASVGYVTGTSMAHFTCLAAARDELLRRQNYDLMANGLRGAPAIRVLVSDDIHISTTKALTLLGFGINEIGRLPVDRQGRIIPAQMPELDNRTLVICQAGNVNSGAYDPFEEICSRANAAGAWVHIDGAIGLWAAASKELRHLTQGMKGADSWTTDTHKWLNTPYDCGLAICRYPEAVERCMSLYTDYLAIGGKSAALPFMVPEMSRRARGVEVWAALRTMGRQGVTDMIERTCRHAARFAEGLRALGFDVLHDVVINQVAAAPPDGVDVAALTGHIQQSGECWIGPTRWSGREAIRISVSSWRTDDADVDRSLRAIANAVDAVRK